MVLPSRTTGTVPPTELSSLRNSDVSNSSANIRLVFDSLCGSEPFEPVKGSYPFGVRVLIPGPRITPRHKLFDYFIDLGMPHIDPIIRHQPLSIADGAGLLFVLPERWMSVHEQRLLLWRLKDHPDVAKVARVDIITQNALLVGGLDAGQVRVFNFKDGHPEDSIMGQDLHG